MQEVGKIVGLRAHRKADPLPESWLNSPMEVDAIRREKVKGCSHLSFLFLKRIFQSRNRCLARIALQHEVIEVGLDCTKFVETLGDDFLICFEVLIPLLLHLQVQKINKSHGKEGGHSGWSVGGHRGQLVDTEGV